MRAARAGGHQAGFTMIELMVVIAIVAVLAGFATPSMRQLVATQRVKSAATDLQLSLLRARVEAIKRNATITVTPVDGDWTAGWSVANPSDASTPLDKRGALTTVSVSTTATQVAYTGTGRATSATAGATFVFGSASASSSRCLAIDPSGRAYLKEGSSC